MTRGVLTSVATIESIQIDSARVCAKLTDGREICLPITWSKRLANATFEQRANHEIEDFGTWVHWPQVDEDIDLASFLGVSEDVVYEALGWEKPQRSTAEYVASFSQSEPDSAPQ
jgi:Protein of unknown function (DUF2442)